MKRLILVCLILVGLVLAACEPGETVTPTDPGPSTLHPPPATATPEASSTATLIPTASLTPTPAQTPTATVPVVYPDPDDLPNLLLNPSFEAPYRSVIFGEVNVAHDWEPFYCDEPYMDEKCPAPRQGDGNPEGLLMGRPEFKEKYYGDYPDEVVEGIFSQTWFCFFRTCWAGVYQTFDTKPDELYEVGVWVSSWYNNDDDPLSDLYTLDDWAASVWSIAIDPNSDYGIKNAFDPDLVACEFESTPDTPWDQQFYDHWVKLSCRFIAQGNSATVFFRNLRIWPVANNDNRIDWAYAVALTGDHNPVKVPTPTPRATAQPPTPTPTPRPMEDRELDPAVRLLVGTYASYPYVSQYERANHSTNSAIVGGLMPGEPVEVYARWQAVDGVTTWFCIDKNREIVPSPEYDWLNILSCGEWVAYRIGSIQYGTADVTVLDG